MYKYSELVSRNQDLEKENSDSTSVYIVTKYLIIFVINLKFWLSCGDQNVSGMHVFSFLFSKQIPMDQVGEN